MIWDAKAEALVPGKGIDISVAVATDKVKPIPLRPPLWPALLAGCLSCPACSPSLLALLDLPLRVYMSMGYPSRS